MSNRGDQRLDRYLDTVGDGSGTKNAIGNYSGAVEEFFIQPPAGESYCLHRMLVALEDAGGNFDAGDYGNGTALTNGVTVQVKDKNDTVIANMTDAVPVKTNVGWGQLCYDVDLKAWGAGNEFLLVRWTFERAGKPLWLQDQEKFVVNLNDDLSGLVSHYFLVQGHLGSC